MRSFIVVAALLALARGSDLDFTAEDASVSDWSTGSYLIQNVETGKNIYFDRTDQVGAYVGSSQAGMILQKVSYEDTNYGHVSGYILEGTTSDTQKCLAAQWNFDTTYKLGKRARDQYAVGYECQLGSDGNGNIDSDTSKEVWIINEVTCAGSSSSSDASTSNNYQEDFAVVKASSDEATTTAAATDDSASSVNWATWKAEATQSVDRNDPSTWVCQHPGPWLYAHSEYVSYHPECKDDLASYRATLSRMSRRSRAGRHADLARRSASAPAKRSASCYTIHPLNHLKDMETLALSGVATTGFGGAAAINIAIADDTSASQQWTISAL
ncbi:hypothetical protein RQP46_003391 [Phenoliferia psychrophenolica]